MHKALMIAALLVAGTVLAGEGQLDTTFGDAGFRIEGFQPAPQGAETGDADIGLAACSGPNGRLIATGLASGLTRVVTMFVTPDGQLDTAIGFGGKQSVAIPEGVRHGAVGLCQPDGKPVLAWNLARSADPQAPRHELQLLRLGLDGLADPAFGIGGLVRVDLDAHVGAATLSQRPYGLIAGPDGDIVLIGSYQRRGRGEPGDDEIHEEGFAARLTASGHVAGVATSPSGTSRARRYLGGSFEHDGLLRLVASDAPEPGGNAILVESEIDYPQMDWAMDTADNSGQPAVLLTGRVIDQEIVSVASAEGLPILTHARRDGHWNRIALPVPQVRNVPARLRSAQVSATPDDGLLVIGAIAVDANSTLEAIYATKLRRTRRGYAVDARFGDGGHVVIPPPPIDCDVRTTLLAFSRFTWWRGAPTVIGTVEALCERADTDYDYVVLRLDAPMFRGDFESPRTRD